MNNKIIAERTIAIYLEVAESAQSTADSSLAASMLTAAYEQINETRQSIDPKTLTKLGELLVLQNTTKKSEEIFNMALQSAKHGQKDDWLQARILDGLTEVYMRLFQLENARKRCEQAIRIITKLPNIDPSFITSRKRKLALINLLQGEHHRAQNILK
jgi:hypothetical protein